MNWIEVREPMKPGVYKVKVNGQEANVILSRELSVGDAELANISHYIKTDKEYLSKEEKR